MYDTISDLISDTPPDRPHNQAISAMISRLEALEQTSRQMHKADLQAEVRQALKETVGYLQSLSHENDGDGVTGSGVGLRSDEIKMLRTFVAEHIREHISPSNLANVVGMGRNKFGRLFYQSFGMTPMRYLQNIRISQAKRLLVWTEMPMEEIAERCGFLSLPKFNRIFSENVGISPRRWRICIRI
jgi:transcriptional regulator GlxA family with amidase domain